MKFLGSRPTHKNINLVKADDPTVHTQNTDQYLDYGGANQVAVGDVKDAVAKRHEHTNKTELDTYSATTQDLEYWVDGTNGSDSNDGSQEHPFATIDKAVSMIPQIVNHSVNIYVADGTYYDDVIIEGRHGTGNISIRGNFSDETAVKVSTISVYRNTCSIGCYAMEFIDDWFNAINLNCNPGSIYLYLITIAQPSSADGFYIESCPAVLLESCEISNRNRAICLFLSTVYMMNCSGSSNIYGIYNDSGIVFTDGSPITGSYSDAEENGGQILSSRLAERDEEAVEGNLAKFDSSGNPVDSGIASNTVPIATTANLTFYVNPSTGNDNNNGSSGSPFKTIAKAVSMIPQIVNHNVTIYLADGNYSEGIALAGYVGRGSISVAGNATTPTNVVLSGRIIIQKVAHYVLIKGMKTTYTGNNSVVAEACSCIVFSNIVAEASDANYSGIYCAFSFAHVLNSTVSNKKFGIISVNASVCSESNGGSGNVYGIAAIYGGTLGKRGAQPAGTTAEYTYAGGEIR